jgi:hypothetical protein
MEMYLKVIGLLPGLEDGLEPFLDDLSFRTFHLLWVTLRTSSLYTCSNLKLQKRESS